MIVQFPHHPGHVVALLGQQAATVIVNAADMRHLGDILVQGIDEFMLRHVSHQLTGMAMMRLLAQRLHRQMQHDLFLVCMRKLCKFVGMFCTRQEGHGHRSRQADGTLSRSGCGAKVIDNQCDGRQPVWLAGGEDIISNGGRQTRQAEKQREG